MIMQIRLGIGFCLLLFFSASIANADLLERMNLEEGFRQRIREVVKVFDPQAQILTQFTYNSYQGKLPGTNLQYETNVIPTNIESRDLARVNVKIYSSKNQFPAELTQLIHSILPVDPKKVRLEFLELKSIPAVEQGFKVSDLEVSLYKVGKELAIQFGVILFATLSIASLIFVLLSGRRSKQFSKDIGRVVDTLSEMKWNSSPATAVSSRKVDEPQKYLNNSSASPLGAYSIESLKGMISDCYWTEKDQYASWIWKNMGVNQRSELLSALSFLPAYSQFIGEMTAVPFPFFDHVCYLKPTNTFLTSQTDLADIVRAYPALWHDISPLRQSLLPLRLEEKLECLKVPVGGGERPPPLVASALRELSVIGQWGDMSTDDEASLVRNPMLVPVHLRSHIKSLVWLGLLPDEVIREKFEKLDARALAAAWIGPEELLSRFESLLPTKKRDLLIGYKDRIPGNRESAGFVWLWEESIKDVAP